MATLYWYGGTGSWNAATGHWSLNSGNAPAADHIAPTASDDVVFDSLSNGTAYTVTITASSVCNNATFGQPATGALTVSNSGGISISGNLSLATGVLHSAGGANWTMAATSGTKTITSNGGTFLDTFVLNGSGGTFQLVDNLNLGASLTYTAGTFDPNGKTVTLNYNQLSAVVLSGAWTFYNLTLTGQNGSCSLSLNSNITVTNTFTPTGKAANQRLLVFSNTLATPRTITAAAVTADMVDFRDITGAGAASWDMHAAAGYTGDCGGNTMQALGTAAFTAAVTTNWQSGATWSTATWSSRVPLPQDTATFTTAGVQTITQDMPRIGSVDFTGSASKTWTTSTIADCYGSINLTNLATLTASSQKYTFRGRGSFTLTCAGKTWAKNIGIDCVTGTLTCKDNFDMNTVNFNLDSGTFDVADSGANHTFKCNNFTSNATLAHTIVPGTGIWTISAGWTLGTPGLTVDWSGSEIDFSAASPAMTLNAALFPYGTIKFTNATPNVSLANSLVASAVTITGSGTLTLSGGASWDVTTLTANTSTVTFTTTGAATITSHGSSFYNLTINRTAGNTTSLSDDLNVSNTLTLTQGTFNANNFNVTAKTYVGSGASTRVLTMGSGTWTLTGTGTVFDHSTVTGLTVSATTSTIVINNASATSKTFAGGGKAYGNITYSGFNIINTGANTFATIALNNNGDTTGITFPASTTTTCTGITSTGAVGNLAKIISSSAGTAATLSKASGTVTVNNVSIKDSAAVGGATFNAVNCTNVSGNSGWNFSTVAATSAKTISSPFYNLS